jgi:hypothetical protein
MIPLAPLDLLDFGLLLFSNLPPNPSNRPEEKATIDKGANGTVSILIYLNTTRRCACNSAFGGYGRLGE